MYRFIPRLASKYAWDTRRFQDQPSLKAIVATLKEAKAERYFLRGQIVFRSPEGTPPEKDVYKTFSGPRELEDDLTALNWDVSKIRQIYLYQFGYFIIE